MPRPPSKRSRKARLAHVLDRGRLVLAPHARELLQSGFDTVGSALRPTLGPVARTVLVEQMNRTDPPELLDDAASVARRIVELPLYRNAGGMLMRHLVWRVLDQVGDGTATASVIAQALLREANRQIAAGANPALLRRGIDSGLVQALEALDRLARPIQGLEALRQVALAAGHDEAIADAIIEIHRRYGMDIVISVQEWLANELAIEVADGAKWNGGFASSEFVNDPERGLAWAESPYILVTNLFLERAEQVIPLMQRVATAGGRALVIIASRISGSALATLLVNNQRGSLQSLAIRAPGEGMHRVGVLQDLAAQTGGRFLSADAGDRVENARIEDLGRCDLVWASRDFFAVIGGQGDPAAIEERVRLIRTALDSEDIPYDRELLRQRLGRLTGGVALLNVGAATKTEMLERKARAERAVKAVEAARDGGVVPGGGVALVAAAQSIVTCEDRLSFDERLGRLALIRAMEEPLRVIVQNAGGEPEPVVHAVRQGRGELGYDATRRQFVHTSEAGIMDPHQVVRAALRSGVSAAVMALLTEALVIPRYRFLHADPKP
jgi:chaperonin GroEL